MATDTSVPLVQQLQTYTPFDELEARYVEQLQQFLRETDNAYDRSNLVAHVVADAWIVNPARDKVVLVEHRLSKRWVAPGGHCDGNPDVLANAIREAEEETGITNLKQLLHGAIFDVHVGLIETRKKNAVIEPRHLHFDLCYAFEVPDATPLTISEESTNLAWVAIDEINNIDYSPGHYRRPAKTIAGWL